MMRRHKIILNPVARHGDGAQSIPRIEYLLKRYDLDFDLVQTEEPWHAAELAREAVGERYDVIVAAGGDGTVNEVLNGLMAAQEAGIGTCTLGVLCIGRGNDFAYGVGIPADLDLSCHALAEGHRRTIDVGRVVGGRFPQGRYFGNGIGIGFDAVVGFEASKLPAPGGFLNYLVAVLKTIFLYYKAPLITLEHDGQSTTERLLMVSIMNGRRMGGGFMMAPEGKPDDGLFDLCIAREVSRARILGLVPHFLRGTQATQEPIRTVQTQRIVATAVDGVLPAHGDGETLSTEGKRLEVELLPQQIEIIVSRDGA
jgi:diacylglycerol kinase (ATP)